MKRLEFSGTAVTWLAVVNVALVLVSAWMTVLYRESPTVHVPSTVPAVTLEPVKTDGAVMALDVTAAELFVQAERRRLGFPARARAQIAVLLGRRPMR